MGQLASANFLAAVPTGPSMEGTATGVTAFSGLSFTTSAGSLKAAKVACASAWGIWAYQAAFRSCTPGVASKTALILSSGAAASIFAKAIVTSSWIFFKGGTKSGPVASTFFFLCACTASFTSLGSNLTLNSKIDFENSFVVGTPAMYVSSTSVTTQSVAFTIG